MQNDLFRDTIIHFFPEFKALKIFKNKRAYSTVYFGNKENDEIIHSIRIIIN